MGLDMYLTATKSLHDFDEKDADDLKKLQELFPHLSSNTMRITSNIGYWRKDNAIHRWFVDNVQDGVDNCQEYYVSDEALRKLIDVCHAVLKDTTKASEFLPTQSGFFFGGTDYDEWYFQAVERTLTIATTALKLVENDPGLYVAYQSSW